MARFWSAWSVVLGVLVPSGALAEMPAARGSAVPQASTAAPQGSIAAPQGSVATPPGGRPAAPVEKLDIINAQGYFSDEALRGFLRGQLSEETRAHLAKSTDAVWVATESTSLGTGSNYCSATIGLTESPEKGRVARLPATFYSSAISTNARGKLDDKQYNDCMTDALRSATAKFVKAGLPAQLEGSDKTRLKGGTRKTEKPSPSSAQLFSSFLTPGGQDRVFSEISSEFRSAFDYRRLLVVITADSFRFGDTVFCFARAGVAARPPDGRNPRAPRRISTYSWEMNREESKAKDAEARCRDDIAVDATKRLMGRSWDDKDLLENFADTREDGVPLVANHRRKPPPAPPDPTRFRQGLKVGSDTHCGLVIQVRPPIAQVQSMIGETWLKIAQLYPPGQKPCRFLNRVYQDPE